MGLYLNIASFVLFLSIIFILIFILNNSKIKKCIFMGILILIIFFAYTKALERKYDNAFMENDKNNNFIVKIVSNQENGNYYNKYVGKVKNGKYKNSKILIYVKDEKEFNYGDILNISGEVSKPNQARNKNGFDYSRYLREKKIYAIITTENYIKINTEKDLFYYIYKVKNIFLSRVDKLYEEGETGFLNAILFGKTDELDEEVRENFKLSNLSHVLAISGMHVSYIVMGLENVLKAFIKNIKFRNFLIIIFLIIFMPFVGGSASVVRACIMTIIAYIAKMFLEKEDFYSSFCIALFILLVMNPYNINSISMWLSFCGSIGIVTFNKFLNKIIIKKKIKGKVFKLIDKQKFVDNENKVLNCIKMSLIKIMEISIMSISAQIIIFPIMLYYFNTLSLTFWISNVLISELIAPILILGYISVISYPLGTILAYIEKILIKIIFGIAYICTKIPFNQIFLPTPKLYFIIIYYCIIVYLTYKFNRRKIYWLRRIISSKYILKYLENNIKYIKNIAILTISLIIFSSCINILPKDLRINFLDVGQGDCTLLRTTHNKVILVDSGEGNSDKYDYGKNVVFPYLLDEGIMKIDYMIISHFDSDHARTECFIY